MGIESLELPRLFVCHFCHLLPFSLLLLDLSAQLLQFLLVFLVPPREFSLCLFCGLLPFLLLLQLSLILLVFPAGVLFDADRLAFFFLQLEPQCLQLFLLDFYSSLQLSVFSLQRLCFPAHGLQDEKALLVLFDQIAQQCLLFLATCTKPIIFSAESCDLLLQSASGLHVFPLHLHSPGRLLCSSQSVPQILVFSARLGQLSLGVLEDAIEVFSEMGELSHDAVGADVVLAQDFREIGQECLHFLEQVGLGG